MKTKMFICIALICAISGSTSFALPPAVETLNDISEVLESGFDVNNICQDGEGNLTVYNAKYDSVLLMNVYRFLINEGGEILEDPRVILTLMGRYDDFKALGDKTGRSHLLAGIFWDTGCDQDEYYDVNSSGNNITEIVSRPPGDLSCCNIISDSIFIATRIGDTLGCWREMDDEFGVEYFQVFRRAPSDTMTELYNLPITLRGFYPTVVDEISENKLLVLADDAWRTRYNYYGNTKANYIASFLIDLDNRSIVNADSGKILDRACYLIPNLNKHISIYRPSALWLDDILLYYFRLPPTEYYKDNVNDTLCILIFDKKGKRINTADEEDPVIVYKSVDRFGSTEQLIPLLIVTADNKWKRKFGLISFRDFPKIYIDLGVE